jgi:hypothetical protein
VGEAPFDRVAAGAGTGDGGKSGSIGAPGRCRSQSLRTACVAGTSGVRRSFLPFPTVCTLVRS